jgi:hypothetical protein
VCRCACVYMCMCVCHACVYMCRCTCTCTCIHILTYTRIHIRTHVRLAAPARQTCFSPARASASSRRSRVITSHCASNSRVFAARASCVDARAPFSSLTCAANISATSSAACPAAQPCASLSVTPSSLPPPPPPPVEFAFASREKRVLSQSVSLENRVWSQSLRLCMEASISCGGETTTSPALSKRRGRKVGADVGGAWEER